MDAEIDFQLRLRNDSRKDIYVLGGAGLEAAISLGFKDHTNGRDVVTTLVPTHLPPPPRSSGDFVKIPKGGYIDTELPVSLKDFGLQVGHQYEIVAKFRSPIANAMNFGLNIWSSEMGQIGSNCITIEIVDN